MNGSWKARLIWVAIGLAVVAGGLWQMYPLPDAARRLEDLPRRGVLFASEDLPVSETEAKIYAGATVLKRLAQVRGQRVVLTIIDGTGNRHAVHDPLFCFRGAGWDVEGESAMAVEWGEARRVQLARRGERADAVYWFTDGDRAFGSPMEYWGRTTLRRITLGASGDEPVLVVITPATDAGVDWAALLAAWPELGAL